MTRPNIQIPNEFAINGEKADFTQEKIQTGFDKLNPDIFAGDNINKFIDDTYKGLNGVLDLYNGVVLHDMTTTYDDKAVVGKFIENSFKLYRSLVNDNTGHEVTETEYWVEVALGGGSGFNLFDTKISDHILEGNEALGWALQGTYVYKDAVPGSRYGYPDFYNRCVEEFEDDGNEAVPFGANVHNTGCNIDTASIVSGFSLRNFIQPTSGFYPNYYEGQPFEVVVKLNATALSGIQTFIGSGDSADYYGILMQFNGNKLRIGASSNGTSWDIINLIAGTKTFNINTDYWFKFEYTGTQYIASWSTDGEIYTPDITIEQASAPAIRSFALGNNLFGTTRQEPLNGTIDLKDCYIKINNEMVWQGVYNLTRHSNGHIFYDIKDKEAVDEWFDTYGIADFYGVDKENERIFLPRNSKFFQFTTDTTKVNDMVEAGLPNIEGVITGFSGLQLYGHAAGGYSSGCIKGEGSARMNQGEGNFGQGVKIDASLSSPIYGKSDTVQPPSSLKLLYYVVGNTDVQSAATDIVDVTTSENDTVPLFTGQYFNFKPNNPSWLKAGEQQDSGGIYTSCYNKLVQALTDNIWEIKVIDSTAMEEGTDYSEYWIVYQDAMRFRTPLTACKEIMPGNEITSSLGFSSNPTNTVESYTVPYNGYITIIGYKTSTSNTLTVKLNGTIVSQTRALASGLSSESYFFARKGDIVTVSTDSTSTGWVIATQTITKATANGELYFKVSNALENLEVINVGQILEALTDKLDKNHSNDTKPYIVEQYQNPNVGTAAGNAGYRKWSNGMMEQWASSDNIGPDSKTTISFLIPFYQNVCVYAQQITGGHASSAGTWSVDAVSNNNFELINYTDVISAVYWFAIGRYQ